MNKTPQEPMIPFQFIRRHFVRIVIGVILVAIVLGVMSVALPYQREQRIGRKVESIGGKVLYVDCWPSWISNHFQHRITLGDRIYCVYNLNGRTLPIELVSDLGTLHCLERLDLSHSHVTDADLEALNWPKRLCWLNLGKTRITDNGIQRLKDVTSLQALYLSETAISNVGLEHLAGLTNLNELYLYKTSVTDSGLMHLKDLTHLKVLDVLYTQVTDAGLEHLTGLKNLNKLSLPGTQTTPEGRGMLRKALPNCGIDWEPQDWETLDGTP